jgi:hypothetical protein
MITGSFLAALIRLGLTKTIAPPIEDNREVLMQLSADLVADARDVDGLVLGNARTATEK